MTSTLDASNLVLRDVHHLLKLERRINNSFTSLLSLEPITDSERQDLDEICHNFESYYEEGKILEGQIKFLLLSPLMWVSGFYHPSIRISLEEGIATIHVEDEDTLIKGRMDILAATKIHQQTPIISLWILLIESKNSSVDASEGLPQLLTYAYTRLGHQESVWGLTTNGMDYQFVYIHQGNPPTYQLFPKLSLMYPDQATELVQVMKAICKVHS
ncbi:MAG TPA: restriction endonuclease subunit R [Cyanobacteria bacterium UBA12227]|nr:restriction endonuclease subunit R [Cyanobacteria bacterium UBA12227]HAX87172.1 restriction endonuclease subunit R [Cyanobacteria bacterium UBA11370]HBY78913.1 restriction endonuclease subunit R [Cyanobacteria bacterium UBA11148]